MSVNKIILWKKIIGHAFTDLFALSLIVSNLITLILAVVLQWNLPKLMWIYWSLSIIIGFFNFLRILLLRDFCTEGFRISDRPVESTRETQIKTVFFFPAHCGFSHFTDSVFLLAPGALAPVAAVDVSSFRLAGPGKIRLEKGR